ncbi:hypothetical protein BOC42_19975 [Burkholderia pseudomallei]|nr:hypothetical protein BOC36_19095 [Burkholderia pseudomallei]ARK62480.1 hypothetical protein BOC37_21620 [Burkholderia pseudomallei]ARK65724.1 hypothetical protein BOC38_02470 [Burkholderia pseudomallei]ARK78553.1 hypothetical protein BOC39_36045 [Burkholderia pseudomallei]ARK89368.1 hypothetical protein BOC42_19975 [Burkholderia pseudomallei]
MEPADRARTERPTRVQLAPALVPALVPDLSPARARFAPAAWRQRYSRAPLNDPGCDSAFGSRDDAATLNR